MKKKNNFYCNKVVYKPWGYEYVVYSDSNRLAENLIIFIEVNLCPLLKRCRVKTAPT